MIFLNANNTKLMKNRKKNILLQALIIIALMIVLGFTGSYYTYKKHYQIKVKNSVQLQELLSYTGKRLPIVSAHRGGTSKNYPENCIETFENTLKHTYAIIECDPRYTRDSAIVLHHDPVLQRTTNGDGAVNNFTLNELKQFLLKDAGGDITDFKIPTLNEALEWAKGKTILVLDQKDVPPAVRLKIAEEHNALCNVIIIVYSFEDAKLCYKLNKNVMMEVMIPSIDMALEFEKTGVPWKNVIAFVGHVIPENKELYAFLHNKGVLCMAGSSRNVDRRYLTNNVSDYSTLKGEYQEFFKKGIDLIETDLPRELGTLLFKGQKIKNKYLN